ncbi:MAG: ATP cone domain-containing protein [Candidatus Shapirobacteria bacterium]|nr:ATP cone domain-containing protein [Candidatus Shapirobacteria bacterium]MDD5073619.1 ATP cone domain-containing protein [Candidatus Shapirobacteria bacterium]MDD5481372.1 ATP cone domain-containing protein [Candidatus Shapirobacteria bacterium]
MKKVKIQKKDGRIEDFDKEKLERSVFSAGATKGQSQLVTQEVEEWLYNVALEEIVNTQEIRNKIIGSLTEKNPRAAKSYQEYQKKG